MPREDCVEEHDRLPDDAVHPLRKTAIELGLNALGMPEEVGGQGVDLATEVMITEELSRVLPGVWATVVPMPSNILVGCEGKQCEKFLYPAVNGEKLDCFALTGPRHGRHVKVWDLLPVNHS